jgi:putative Mg2+ transporter-C (MgtC) family protein
MEAAGESLFALPQAAEFVHVLSRLLVSLVLGAALGFERERAGKAAGLRTHALVALGATMFVAAGTEAGMTPEGLSRVVQGIVAGIGFLGAGAILKVVRRREVEGLTTAANIWFTAAVGTAVGAGHLWLPVAGTVMALLVLGALSRLEPRPRPPDDGGRGGS